jgi:hypothetical protein
MGWIETELVLVTIAAMLSPTTLTFSTLELTRRARCLHARTVAAALFVLVSLALLRNGIAGLTA